MQQFTQKALECGHNVTIEGRLKMGEFRRWMAAEKAGEFGDVFPILAKLITAWDWPGLDPKKVESYDELEMFEYKQVLAAVVEHVTAEAAAKN